MASNELSPLSADTPSEDKIRRRRFFGWLFAIILGFAVLMIALYYFINSSLKDPCAGKLGKSYNSELQKCVPDNCGNGEAKCMNPKAGDRAGTCVKSATYCPQGYEYDEESCDCKKTCPDGQYAYTKNGEHKSRHAFVVQFNL